MKARCVLPLLTLLCFLPRFVAAVVVAPMTDAEWFAKSNKILVLEYESPLGGKEGAQLSQLLGWMALATASGIDQFAVVTLQQTETHLELTDANVKSLGERQHAAVVIWGEFYQQAGRVFVTSHLRYTPQTSGRDRGPNAGKFSWNISQLNIAERTEAYASLPSSQINFSPIEISTADLSSLQEVWRKTVIIRLQPDEASAKLGELSLATPYSVGETANGWTRVSTKERSGWVRWADLSGLSDFKDLTGVLQYAQGLMQFLTGNPRGAEETFKRYLGKYAARQDPMNKAVAHLFAGYSGMKGAVDWEFSIKQFETAKALLPNASSPANCMALVLFAKAARAALNENETLSLEKNLIRAVQTESDVDSIRNLEILYQLPQAEAYFKKKNANFVQARDRQLTVLRNLEQQAHREPNG
ncbi:MAG: hypothetical protein V7609_2679 [Verrucomicrobiota bacterium]